MDNYIKSLKDKYLGATIEIVRMAGEPDYTGRIGVVQYIDSVGQLHGSWGGLAVILSEDEIKIVKGAE